MTSLRMAVVSVVGRRLSKVAAIAQPTNDAPPAAAAAAAAPDGRTYRIVAAGTKRHKSLLIDQNNYKYQVDKRRGDRTYWRCCSRSTTGCKATVIQLGDSFTPGRHQHVDESIPGVFEAATVRANVVTACVNDLFRSANEIVEDALHDMLDDKYNGPCKAFANPCNLARYGNRARQRMRPQDPNTLDFDFDYDFEGHNFLKADIRRKSQRHLLFATDDSLSLLSKAKTWYMDGTFKVVHKPFVQLFSVHAFVQDENSHSSKQVPLVFCLMSKRRFKDYKSIFKELLNLLDTNSLPCRVETIVCDFEKATWQAVRDLFPNVRLLGCFFHWSQAVLRKLKAIGLQTDYSNDSDIHNFCRKLFALPFLPAVKIPKMFAKLFSKANSVQLNELCCYLKTNWIDSRTWPPECWSVYRRVIRTNNDVEGWHFRLNARARKNSLPFYVLVRLLYREASAVKWQMKLLSDGKLLRRHRKCYRSTTAKLETLWTDYENEQLSTRKLLSACSKLYNHKC